MESMVEDDEATIVGEERDHVGSVEGESKPIPGVTKEKELKTDDVIVEDR